MWERGVSSGGKPVLRSEETLWNRSLGAGETPRVAIMASSHRPGASHRRSRLSLPACQLFHGIQLPEAGGRKGERLFAACLSLSGSAVPKYLPRAPVLSSWVFS